MRLFKHSLSLLLVCLLCFGLFSVNVSAVEVSENLIDSNLSNWTDFGEENQYFQSANVSYLENNVNYIEVQSSDTSVYLFDITEFLKVGESYNFTFSLPTTGGANSNSLNSCDLNWFLTDGGGDLYPTVGNDVFQISINNSNKSNYLGKSTTFEFTYTQGFKNTFLCLSIVPAENLDSYNDLQLYISDISLERVASESEKKLDGILSWLEDIKNSITGLGDKLTSVWENITSSVSNLGDRISVFFTDLSNTISTKFNELITNFGNFITNLGDRISGFFENLITNVKTFFEELPRKIFNYEIEVTDDDIISDGSGSGEDDEIPKGFYYEYDFSNLTKFGSLDNYGGFAELLPDNILYYKARTYPASFYDYSLGAVIPKDDFEVLKTYKLEFTISNLTANDNASDFNTTKNRLYVKFPNEAYPINIPFTGNGTYSYTFSVDSVKSDFEIYRIYLQSNYACCLSDVKVYEVVDTGTDEEPTTTKVSWFQYLINKFKSWFNNVVHSVGGFFTKLFEDIRSLFIPSEGYFDNLSNRFDLLIEERFGALVTITDYLVEFFGSFNADVTKEYFDVPIININLLGYNFPIGGWQVRFVPQFNGVEILTNACKFISSVLATFAFFDGLKKKYHEVFGGGE